MAPLFGRDLNPNATRRQWALLVMILLTMPALAQLAFGAVDNKLTTEQVAKILSSPLTPMGITANGDQNINLLTNKQVDYHGIVHTHDEATEDKANEDEEATRGGREHGGSRGKSRTNMALYPPRNKIPDVNSPQVKAWVAEIDWSKVPNIPVAEGIAPETPHFPKCPPDEQMDRTTCWWSCYGCTAPTDVITCPLASQWGLTYDDGPSLVTRNMTKFLMEKKITATFFVVGSRVLEYPDILREQVAQGHHIGMHTWSHSGLTTLTNQEIVAEIRWSEKAIRDVTGLTMKYVRPPFGDIDNRVREILRQMGYTVVIWTKGWDTNDWRMLMHEIPEREIIQNFKDALDNRAIVQSSNNKPAGPITLEHDLSKETVRVSKTLIEMAVSRGLHPMNVATCLGDMTPYQRGSKLGPGGAVEKINGGDFTGSYRGMTGMEEQDYNTPSRTGGKKGEAKSSSSSSTSDAVAALQRSAIYAAMGLAAVASVMLTL
ncbi:chitin deacetylase [Mortierella hygrophila]|uniref:Chitin deacetylase n=1 Tax=Mortierella hygrophila TaxID=979708 RepID=A0A9P6K615_9FUNG|nr:chitin deacetylase [Mortierella hygrophila]